MVTWHIWFASQSLKPTVLELGDPNFIQPDLRSSANIIRGRDFTCSVLDIIRFESKKCVFKVERNLYLYSLYSLCLMGLQGQSNK